MLLVMISIEPCKKACLFYMLTSSRCGYGVQVCVWCAGVWYGILIVAISGGRFRCALSSLGTFLPLSSSGGQGYK